MGMDKKKRNTILAVIGGILVLSVIIIAGYWGIYIPVIRYQLESGSDSEILDNTQQSTENNAELNQGDSTLTTTNLDQTVKLEEYDIEFKLPSGWNKKEARELDAYYKEPEEQAGFAAFVYTKEEFEEGYTKEDMFELQNEVLLEGRDSAEEVGELENITLEDIQVMKKTYRTSTDGNKNLYNFYWITFRDNEDLSVWVLINGVPKYIEDNKELVNQIVASAKWTGGEE